MIKRISLWWWNLKRQALEEAVVDTANKLLKHNSTAAQINLTCDKGWVIIMNDQIQR